MARMRPSSKVNMNERKLVMGLSHTEPKYLKRVEKSENGPKIGIGMHKIAVFPY